MTALKIHRVNRSKYLIKDGKTVVRECSSYKEAMNALISEDLLLLDSVDEFCDTTLDDLDLMEQFAEVA